MTYKIIEERAFQIIGLKAQANFETNGQVTAKLAREFMPRLKEVANRKDHFSLSLQNYDNFNVSNLSPTTSYEKWIGVEVYNLEDIPVGMYSLEIETGSYFVIDFKGSIPEFMQLWQHIQFSWLPKSEFELDNRPHFERLPPSYSPANASNEEEIWIPIK